MIIDFLANGFKSVWLDSSFKSLLGFEVQQLVDSMDRCRKRPRLSSSTPEPFGEIEERNEVDENTCSAYRTATAEEGDTFSNRVAPMASLLQHSSAASHSAGSSRDVVSSRSVVKSSSSISTQPPVLATACTRPTPFSISDILDSSRSRSNGGAATRRCSSGGTSVSVLQDDQRGSFCEEVTGGGDSPKSISSSEEGRESDSDTERSGSPGVCM